MSTQPPKSRHPGFRLSKYAGHQWSTYFGWPNVNLCGTCSTLQRQIVGFLKTHPWCTDSIFHDPVNLMPTWTFLRSGHLLKVARGSLTPETLNSAGKPWFGGNSQKPRPTSIWCSIITRNIPVWNRRRAFDQQTRATLMHPTKEKATPLTYFVLVELSSHVHSSCFVFAGAVVSTRHANHA